MKTLTDEEFEALKRDPKNAGKAIERIDNEPTGLCYVFAVPGWADWAAYQRDAVSMESRHQVIKQRLQLQRLHPSAEELDAYLARYPGAAAPLMGEVGEAAGAGLTFTRKK